MYIRNRWTERKIDRSISIIYICMLIVYGYRRVTAYIDVLQHLYSRAPTLAAP